MFGSLLTFAALVASGITFSGKIDKKVLTADDLPISQHYVVPAGTVTSPYTYTDGPSTEPKYSGSTSYKNTSTGSDGVYYSFSENATTYGRMNVASTWNSYRGEGVKVAVIDTGCYTSHEDFSLTNFSSLSKNIYSGGTTASDYTDTNGHGTSSVSTIAASINSVGGLGIAPNVELVVLKIDHPTYGMQVSYINSALQWCIDNDVDVINLSVQGYASSFSYSYTEDFGNVAMSGTSQGTLSSSDVSTKINACYNAGITVVAAAGNYNSSNESYPAANDHVIAVASTGLTEANKLNKAGYSNYGDWVDICAPGYIMTPTTSSTSSYSITYGTSFSAPLVTGAIALYKCKYPDATPDQIEKALKFTATELSWTGSGAGAIDVGAFLAQAPDYKYVESLSLSENSKTLKVGDTYTLNPTILPSDAANKNIVYESSNPSVCSVNENGVVTANSVGSYVYIYATSAEDSSIYDYVAITVEAAADTPQTATVPLSSGTSSGDPLVITWTIANVLTITQEKSTGQTAPNASYISAPRWYQNNLITFTPIGKTITKVEITCSENSYASVLSNSSTTWSAGSASSSSTKATWTGQQSSAFTVKPNAQVRISSISVTYIEGSSGVTNYTVTFNSNGGTGTMTSQTTSGSSYTTPSCTFTYTGYTFSKWALNSAGGTQYSAGQTITNISANITLYAIWTQNGSVTEIDDDYGNYYSSITTQTGSDLQTALNNLNNDHRTTISYANMRYKFQYVDLDWTNTTNMYGFYDNTVLSKTWDSGATWNREHVWPQSLGGDQVENDMHMVRPASVSTNSGRGNDYYASSVFDPGTYDANYRGIAARIIFYCAIADTDLSIIDANSGGDNQMGKLSDLLQWNLNYLPDRKSSAPLSLRVEQYRNKILYSGNDLQGNRNPFIDHPEYACKIWGNTNSTTRQICGINGSLTLSESSKSLTVDQNFTLTATASGGTGSVLWSSSDETVCTLSTTSGNSVTVTGVGAGTATITASYGSLTATCTVTVTGSGGTTPSVNSVTVSPKTMTLNISSGSASGTITPTVNVSGGAATTVNWTVSPSGQGVTVSGGTVTAAANATTGTYTVTATSTVDNTKSDYCTVTVTNSGNSNTTNVDLDNGTFSNSKITWRTEDDHCTVEQMQTGGNAVSSDYISNPRVYKSNTLCFTADSGYKIASISLTYNGTYSGKNMTAGTTLSNSTVVDDSTTVARTWDTTSGGTHTVSSVSSEGLQTIYIQNVAGTGNNNVQFRPTQITISYVEQSVTPTPTLTSITLNTDNVEKTFNVGDTFSYTGLVVIGHYSDSTSETISSGYEVSTPDMSSAGTKTVTVSYGGQDATFTITVSNVNVTGVLLNKSTTSLAVGSTETLTATITPSNATNKNVTWTSSSPTVATVSNGTVTAVAIGTTTITVTTSDGGYTDTCTVTVTAAPTVTYELEADDTEIPYMNGTNHTVSVSVKLYQYNNGVKGSQVASETSNVDTSSLGQKTVSLTYQSVVYTTNVKVTNHGASGNVGISSGGTTDQESKTYTMSSATEATGGITGSTLTADGTGFEGSNLQRGTQWYQTAGTISISSIGTKTIKSIVVVCSSNGNSVSISSKVGSTEFGSSTIQKQNDQTITFTSSQGVSGSSITISIGAGSKSIWVKTVSVTYDIVVPGTTYPATPNDQAKAWATYFISETRTAETCLAELDSEKLAGLQAKWADLAYEYTEMIGDSKDEFCTSSDATIVEARSHYLFIVSKFGASNLGTDGAFVKNSQNQVLSAKANNPLVFLKGISSIPIIVIMSVISVTSIGLYFYLRKRKEE